MSKEAMKLALEALVGVWKGGFSFPHVDQIREAITALREALANEALDKMAENARELGLDYEPAQTVLASAKIVSLNDMQGVVDWLPHNGAPLKAGDYLYTSPPASKPWVGLDHDDIHALMNEYFYEGMQPSAIHFANFARAIEAKLKEKNT